MKRGFAIAVWLILATAVAAALLPAGAAPASAQEAKAASAVPVPSPTKGRGDKCVADTEWMRRNHMTALKHQRDETVHEGIRGAKFSLKGCVDCHAVNGPDGKAVTIESPQHFCRACHDYAAVRVDCFECHASRPDPATTTGTLMRDGHEADIAALAQYLRSAEQ